MISDLRSRSWREENSPLPIELITFPSTVTDADVHLCITAFISILEIDVGSMNHRFSRFSQLSPFSSLTVTSRSRPSSLRKNTRPSPGRAEGALNCPTSIALWLDFPLSALDHGFVTSFGETYLVPLSSSSGDANGGQPGHGNGSQSTPTFDSIKIMSCPFSHSPPLLVRQHSFTLLTTLSRLKCDGFAHGRQVRSRRTISISTFNDSECSHWVSPCSHHLQRVDECADSRVWRVDHA